jgi:hypothetical protein
MNEDTDFYVGYLPHAPISLRRFVQRIVLALGLLVILVAGVLALSQMPFARSYFEFGNQRDFQGTLVGEPYPTLVVRRPGQAAANVAASEYLLVAPGKHGANALIHGFAGQEVTLRGQLIYREGKTMIEIDPGSVRVAESLPATVMQAGDLARLTLTGEIVDSKCYIGVMNPGNGKVHRDCASRCLSGSIPPLFIEQKSGNQFVLVAHGGKALPYESIKAFIGEPLTITGELLQRGDVQLLEIEPRELRHAD